MIGEGVPFVTALRMFDIGESTGREWLTRGRTEPGSIFECFLLDVERANAHCEIMLVSTILGKALDGSSFAAQFLLTRRFRERWGDRAADDPLETPASDVSSDGGRIDLGRLSNVELEHLGELLRRAEGHDS